MKDDVQPDVIRTKGFRRGQGSLLRRPWWALPDQPFAAPGTTRVTVEVLHLRKSSTKLRAVSSGAHEKELALWSDRKD